MYTWNHFFHEVIRRADLNPLFSTKVTPGVGILEPAVQNFMVSYSCIYRFIDHSRSLKQ